MYIVGLFLMFLTCIVTGQESKYCLADDNDPYLYFGITTSYHAAHGTLTTYNDCEPTQLYVVTRHGTQYPGKKIFSKMKILSKLRDKIVTNHENKLGELCDKDLEHLKSWILNDNFTDDDKHHLSPQGEIDMRELAKRLKAAFPTLFTTSFTSNMKNYEFASAKTPSTTKSMLVFAEELLGTKTEVKRKELRDFLRAAKKCPAWKREKNTGKYFDEYDKFRKGQEVHNVLVKVSRRLGFHKDLSTNDIIAMYEICRLDKALNINAISAWCAAFSKEELKVLEYQYDLFSYYNTGPGRSINAKIGCPLKQDLFEHFRKLEGSDFSQEPKGIFYFVHLGTLNPLLAALGIKNDEQPLLASNFEESEGHLWRTSHINPFATNLVAAFYRCSGKSNKVVFHLAEHLVEYEGCNEGVCDWQYIRNTLEQRDEKCNVDFCNIENEIPKKMSKLTPEPMQKLTSKSISRSISNFNIILSIFLLAVFNKDFI